MQNGDFSRFAKRRWRFPPPGEGGVNGLGLLQIIPDITGILSGRIRTDSFENFSSDMVGIPSPEDERRRREELRKRLYPECKGQLCV